MTKHVNDKACDAAGLPHLHSREGRLERRCSVPVVVAAAAVAPCRPRAGHARATDKPLLPRLASEGRRVGVVGPWEAPWPECVRWDGDHRPHGPARVARQ